MDTLDMVHNIVRYILLVLLVVNLVSNLHGWLTKRKYSNIDDKLSLGLFITTHIQLTIGLVLYFMWTSKFSVFTDMKGTMHNPIFRYFTVEHIAGMLIAIVLISLGRILAKKALSDEAKFQKAFIFFALGVAIIAAMLLHMPVATPVAA